MHFVTPDTDAGPIVMQGAVAVHDDDTAQTLSERDSRRRAPDLSSRRCDLSPTCACASTAIAASSKARLRSDAIMIAPNV